MNVKKMVGTLLLLLVVALISQAPARLALAFIPEDVLNNKQWHLQSVSGTIWRGSLNGLQVAAGSRRSPTVVHVKKLAWQLSPWSLLSLNPAAELTVAGDQFTLSANLQWQGGQRFALDNVDAQSNAAWLSTLLAGTSLANTMQATGQVAGDVSVLLDAAVIDGERLERVSGRLVWQQAEVASISGPTLVLGDFAVELETEAQVISAQLFNLAGAMQLDITSQLTPSGELSLQGSVGFSDDSLAEVESLVQMIAQPGEEGRYRLEWKGKPVK